MENKMKKIFLLVTVVVLSGCVAGSPTKTDEQFKRISDIKIFKVNTQPNRKFTILGEISAADCSGIEGTALYGKEEKSIEILVKKAIVLNADAIVNVSCGSVPYINNCWIAQKCDGNAVKWN